MRKGIGENVPYHNLLSANRLLIISVIVCTVSAFAADTRTEPVAANESRRFDSPISATELFTSSDHDSINRNPIASTLSTFFTTGAVRYRLIEGSTLVDDCLLCMRPPTIPISIRGTFWLTPTEKDMWFSYFAIRNLRFTSTGPPMGYSGRMDGHYEIGGDFAFVHQMTLQGSINEFQDLKFDSGVAFPQVWFPWIEIDLCQVPPTDPVHTFSLHLVAVPWPSIWFSTEMGFHSSNPIRVNDAPVSDGDLLCSSGRIVRTNNQLTARLGIMPVVPDIGLDAVMRGKPSAISQADYCRCEIWFSAEQDIFSETLGPLHHGDLLSDSGRIVRSYRKLTEPFSPEPPAADYGLDAIAIGPNVPLLFSTKEDFFSERMGMTVRHGDLLCEDGSIFKTNAELMARFEPIEPVSKDFGLDAVYIWPHREIWFSTTVDITDKRFGHIGHGDLLSDTGRVVARNLELVGPFRPVEDVADFGLDGLHILRPHFAADFTGDGNVNLVDFAVFSSAWFTGPGNILWNPDYDISADADDSVDILDLSVLTDDWIQCAE